MAWRGQPAGVVQTYAECGLRAKARAPIAKPSKPPLVGSAMASELDLCCPNSARDLSNQLAHRGKNLAPTEELE